MLLLHSKISLKLPCHHGTYTINAIEPLNFILDSNFPGHLEYHSNPEEEIGIVQPNENDYKLAIHIVTDTRPSNGLLNIEFLQITRTGGAYTNTGSHLQRLPYAPPCTKKNQISRTSIAL